MLHKEDVRCLSYTYHHKEISMLCISYVVITMRRVPEECTEAALELYRLCVHHNHEDRPTSLKLVDELRRIQPDEFAIPDQIL
jgi:hypothetical protein